MMPSAGYPMPGFKPVTSGNPQVTVIMNCYNGQRYLREAIDSVYAQDMADWEIVFWDNQSTDESPQIARSYDQRLRYFRAEQRTSLSPARALALVQARGNFIAFLDVDDVWYPNTLSRLVAGMDDSEHVYAVCYGGFQNIDGNGAHLKRTLYPARRGNVFDCFLHQFEITPCAAMLRNSVLQRTGLTFDPHLTASEEYCLFMQLAVDHPFHALPEVVAKYRIHEGALTNKTIAKWAEEWQFTLDLIVNQHPGIIERYREGFCHAQARVDYYHARYLMYSNRPHEARRKLWPHRFLSGRYFILAFLAFFPRWCWDRVHTWYHGRSQLG